MCLFEVRVANNGSVKARGLGRQHQSEMAGDGRRRQDREVESRRAARCGIEIETQQDWETGARLRDWSKTGRLEQD